MSFQKLNVVLDLDNTLIISIPANNQTSPPVDDCIYYKVSDTESYWMIGRPYLHYFLQELNKIANISVWTAATQKYAEIVLHHFFPKNITVHNLLTQKDTIYYSKNTHRLKPIDVLFNARNSLIIDDLLYVQQSNPGNVLPIIPYTSSRIHQRDTELIRVLNKCIDQYYYLNAVGHICLSC